MLKDKGIAVVFGGAGFIGIFFAQYLIEKENFSKVYIYDNNFAHNIKSDYRKKILKKNTNIILIKGDVKKEIEWFPQERVDIIANFAAVHREPGHDNYEYYECNLLGAENICNWADKVNCNQILFTSSIAPYGPSEEPKDENSLPLPETAYGGSKLVAEKIHLLWQSNNFNKRLVIVRPGVVFGPTENGNVSRLIKAINRRYFFYMGNRNTRKAGIYVKELCNAMTWAIKFQTARSENVILFNMTMNPGPSIEEYANAIIKILNKRIWIPSMPKAILLSISYILVFVLKPFKINHPFSPIRLKKLQRSNNILPSFLINNGYEYQYDLEEALRDWKDLAPEEWQ